VTYLFKRLYRHYAKPALQRLLAIASGMLTAKIASPELCRSGRFSADIRLRNLWPFRRTVRARLRLYTMLDYLEGKPCAATWTFTFAAKPFSRVDRRLLCDYPRLYVNGQEAHCVMQDNALENGKYAAFIALSPGPCWPWRTRSFKFFHFLRSVKKRERLHLDKTNRVTYAFLHTKPFSKSAAHYHTVWAHNNARDHILHFNAYVFSFIAMLARADFAPGARILDIGAGSCWTSEWLSRLGFEVVAYDISLETLAVGHTRLQAGNRPGGPAGVAAARSADFLTCCGDSEHLPFARDSFAGMVCMETLHHVPAYLRVVAEAYHVLAPGGRLVILEPGRWHSESREALITMRDHGVLENSMDKGAIKRKARQCGFRTYDLLIPFNTTQKPRAYPWYSHGFTARLLANVWDWFGRLRYIPRNMKGGIFLVLEK